MNKKKHRLADARKAKDKRGLRWGVGATVVLIALLVAGSLFKPSPCRHDKPPNKRAVRASLLIDISDPIPVSLRQRTRDFLLRDLLEIPSRALSQGEWMSVYQLNDGDFGPDDATYLCAPRNPVLNPVRFPESLWVNSALVQRRYESFSESLGEVLSSLLAEVVPKDSTPLLRGIQSASVHSFPPLSNPPLRRLYLVSDMLENSDWWSCYSGPVSFESLQRNPNYPTYRPNNLKGVSVKDFLLPRGDEDRRRQVTCRERLWEPYFVYEGADPRSVVWEDL